MINRPLAEECCTRYYRLETVDGASYKRSWPIRSSGSKPITKQDLAEVLTLSQEGLLPESTNYYCIGLNASVNWKAQPMQRSLLMILNWNLSKPSFQAKRRMQLLNSHLVEHSTRTLWRLWRGSSHSHKHLWWLISKNPHNLQLRKYYQFCFMYIQSRRYLIAKLWILLEEYFHFESRYFKIPPNMKKSWSLPSVKRCWTQPTVLDFNDWLRDKAEAHEYACQSDQVKTWEGFKDWFQ